VKASVPAFQKQFFPNDVYSMRTVTRWNDQVEPMFGDPEPPKAPETRRGFGQGGGRGQRGAGGPGGPGAGPGGAPGPNARGGFNEWTSSSWQLVEVTLINAPPATTQPAKQ